MTSATVLPAAEAAARLATATIAGATLGVNRNLRGKAAGLRTHALVALGAALVTAAAAGADPAGATRVMQGVITGIGFIGAGVILHPRPPAVAVRSGGVGAAARPSRPRRRRDVRGLTTAATVWVAAGLGLASGLGAWVLVLLGTGLTLAVLVAGGRVEAAVRRRLLRRLRRRRALEHHHRAGHVVRVREREVDAHDA
ncbi:hypothetical protein tb265_31700 [Gemmatimonadetes bacterium T265]|nr:hypothetical protein tb265_31700 [Gemmatimonadetes bacterium T265]